MPENAKNKVKYNLKNVHFAPINRETGEYGDVFKHPGAVSLTLDAQGDIEKFYADGIVYYKCANNNGYDGSLEMAMITDEFREKILNEVKNADKVMVENVKNDPNDFAMGFQIDGDIHETLFWFYNCAASRPSVNAQTKEESKTPQTDTLSVFCTCDEDGNVRAKTTDETEEAIKKAWFEKVYKGEAA